VATSSGPGNTHTHTNAHTQVLDVSTVTASAAVDLFLLAEGDMFVGAFGGHMSRLAFELLVGLRGRVVPYVSGKPSDREMRDVFVSSPLCLR